MFSAHIATTVNPNWIEATHQACQQRLQSLDNLYFLRGKRHLENLKLWAAGRSAGPPLKTALP
jgi:hypothetical protein